MMRIRLSGIFSNTTARLAGAVCLASLAAGCSSEVMRFEDGMFTGSVPAPVGANTRPVAANTAPAVAQPYPGDVRPQTAQYDRTYTGSVPAQRATNLTPPTNIQPVYQRPVSTGYQQQAPVYQPAQQPTVVRQPLRSAPAIEAQQPQVRLAPVPVSNEHTSSLPSAISKPQSITKTVNVPVARIPVPSPARRGPVAVRTVQAPVQAFPQTVAAANVAPDPMITGTTPASAAARQSTGTVQSSANGWTTTGGTRVTIGQGETIYNLSRRYGVPAKEILKANGITDASRINSGQVVVIPTYVYSRKAPVSAPDNDPKTRAARASTGYQGEARPDNIPLPRPAPSRQFAVLPSPPSTRQAEQQRKPVNVASAPVATVSKTPAKPAQSAVSATAGSAYTVQPGDSLSRIASRSGASVSAIKQANGLSKSMIRVGQKLVIPKAAAGLDTVQTASVPKKTIRPAPVAKTTSTASVTEKSKVKANAPKTTGIDKLRWPAKGQVMSKFGSMDGSSKNDGIDISVPQGTPVKAAENGVVIYSGSGLKEYGNTVLVRHDNGLVSVYGHASELVVQRGDNVSRGQVVALSGMSGKASRPKLHFEIRKNAKPVNPLTYLE
jgi:LysM repeat protein